MSLDQTKRPDDDDEVGAAPRTVPTLRLLFSKEDGVVQAAARPLALGTLRIGRGVPVDEVCLAQDSQASREHAAIVVGAGQPPRLRDLGSSNGTFVNGVRLSAALRPGEVVLRDGDVLRVGGTLFLFREEPAALWSAPDTPSRTLLGQSPAMRRLRRELAVVAPSLATVLLLGESGTGKEVTARALHELSGVKGPLVAVNCAAIPESLAESQLFGHVAGAFTGAKEQPGCFRAAHGGTLFLDEVGELPLTLQPKLLRALEEGAVTPVGSVVPLPCRPRLIAATNRDLETAVSDGKVRGDLFARLAEIVLRLPPLRERREDILLILREALGPSTPPLTPRLAEALLLHPWPFNVRELHNVIEYAFVIGEGPVLEVADLPPELGGMPQTTLVPSRIMLDRSRAMDPHALSSDQEEVLRIEQALTACHGQIGEAAKLLSMSRVTLWRKMKVLGLSSRGSRVGR